MTSYRKYSRMLNGCVALGVLTLWAGSACAQTQQPPNPLFQFATITGYNNAITATSIPVVLSTGVTVYVNLTIQFTSDSNGNLTVATGYPQQTAAQSPVVAGFMAGSYVGPSTVNSGNNLITVAGPGVTSGGATEWTLTASSGASIYTYPSSATWYVGPNASSPIAARLQAAGITSTAWSYGVGSGTGNGLNWGTNSLIGVSQVGNTITFVSFSIEGSTDKSVPVDQITYTLKQ